MKSVVILSAILVMVVPSCIEGESSSTPAASSEPGPQRYCVVSLVDPSDPYFAAVGELQKQHGDAVVITADAATLEGLLVGLREANPDYVAVVVKPDLLDVNLVRRLMRLATEIDDDPFLDFAYGFITGDSAQAAVALVKAGQVSDLKSKPAISMVGVAGGDYLTKSQSTEQQLPLRRGYLKQTAHTVVNTGKQSDRDTAYIESVMPKLEGSPIVLLAGHGYPREVVGGPTYEDLRGRDYAGAVAMNIACYTGVTGTWYEDDWQTMQVKQRNVPLAESFCLNMLNTGVAGYVAYACPRPAGPTMLGDVMTAAIAGSGLGELRRVDGNNVVLAHLQQGFDSLQVKQETDGDALSRNRKTQELLLAMSTGGMLFGDPACKPFAASQGANPRSVQVTENESSLQVRVEVTGPLWHFFCADQIVMWDETTPSFRIEASIPLGDRHASDVQLKDSAFGDVPHQLIAVTEQHLGERRLHLKASFKQPPMPELMKLSRSGVFGRFEVTTSATATGKNVIRRGVTR